MLLLALW